MSWDWDPNGRRSAHDQRRAARYEAKLQRQAEKDQDKLPLDQREDTRIEPGMSEDEVEKRIRRRIEQRRKDREGFLYHLVSFIGVNAVLWGIYAFSGGRGGGFPWPAYVTLFWGIGLVSHALVVYQNSAAVVARRELAMQREIELEKARLGLRSDNYDYVGEKPKRTLERTDPTPIEREQRVRLSDDGELVPVDEDERGDSSAKVNSQRQSMRRASDDEQSS